MECCKVLCLSDVTSSLQFAASCDENTEGYSGSARSPTAEALRAEFGRVKCSQEMGELRYFSEKKKKKPDCSGGKMPSIQSKSSWR